MVDLDNILRTEPAIVTAFSALKFVKLNHDQHLQLCDLLEEIADSLPDRVDERQCVYAADALRYRVNIHHQLEEEVLFPRLMARATGDRELRGILNRLADEHRTDEGHCEEAIELLTKLSHGMPPPNVEAAGYMLRGLFEGLRRHIAFENDHVLPMAQALLQEDDLEALACEIRRTDQHPEPAGSSH
ncbi:MAG: hemerythrin domain-containing protein [Rhizobiales bacterium]|nr:hemerythrin domain-containing protein [Hyphomicrobiales bacterium]